jgi:hypothetical protein
VKAAPYQDLSYLCTATHGDGIYQLDAYGATNLASTQKYNAQTDVWTSVRRIPTSRTSGSNGAATAVTVGSGIYVSGAYWSPATAVQVHEMYYPVVDIWTTKKAVPNPNYYVMNQAGGAWGSTVMLAGGYPYSNQFHRYSAVTDTWTSGECLLRLAPSVAVRSPAQSGVRRHPCFCRLQVAHWGRLSFGGGQRELFLRRRRCNQPRRCPEYRVHIRLQHRDMGGR